MEREVGGGIEMGNTCKPMADSFQCMTKPTTIKKKKKKHKKNHVFAISLFPRTNVLKFSFIFLNIILYYSLQINHIISQTFPSSLKTYCKCNF